jgi:hypothetical protein
MIAINNNPKINANSPSGVSVRIEDVISGLN